MLTSFFCLFYLVRIYVSRFSFFLHPASPTFIAFSCPSPSSSPPCARQFLPCLRPRPPSTSAFPSSSPPIRLIISHGQVSLPPLHHQNRPSGRLLRRLLPVLLHGHCLEESARGGRGRVKADEITGLAEGLGIAATDQGGTVQGKASPRRRKGGLEEWARGVKRGGEEEDGERPGAGEVQATHHVMLSSARPRMRG